MTSGFGMFDAKLQERGGRNDSADFEHVDGNILQSCFTVRLNRIHILRFLFQAQEFMKFLRVYSHHRSNALI